MKLQNILRSLGRNKMVLVTNLTGLSIGLAATILLAVFILHETSYDKYFSNAHRIYRLNTIWIGDGKKSVFPINLRTSFTDIPHNVSGIENAVQLYRGGAAEIRHDETRFAGNNLMFADDSFFKIFHFKFIEGGSEHALDAPDKIVVTKKVAAKIFGSQAAAGQHLEINGKSYTVSAVMEDVPLNTHFQFDIMLPMQALDGLSQLGGLEFLTYYLINPNSDAKSVCSMICAQNTKMLKERFKDFKFEFESITEPLPRIHLYSKVNFDVRRQGNINTIILVTVIAFMILFLAMTNFINLFITEGEQRSKEIGVRKTIGADKIALFKQFFGEVAVIVSISFIIGMILSLLLLPRFGNLMQRQFSVSLLKSPLLLLSIACIFLLTVLFSGSYPALYLSRLKPVSVLKKNNRRKYLTNITGTIQLIITLFLFTTLFGINKEIRYLKNLSPGFNPDGLVNIYNLNDKMKSQYPAIRNKLLSIPEIAAVGASSHTIGGGCSGQSIRLLGSTDDKMQGINEYRIQPGLCELLQLNLVEGRFFDPERITDRNGVILNEAAMNKLGLTSGTGKQVVMFEKPMEIIGVVKNFRYESAANTIQPLVLTAYSENFETIMIRISPKGNYASALKKVEDVLKSFDSGYIITSTPTNTIYRQYYADEDRLTQLTSMGAIISFVIVLMGIFLLVTQNISRHTKEIGIKKVLGSSVTGIIVQMYSNTIRWTLISAVIAIPLSYMYLHSWMHNYIEKTPMSWWVFFSGLIIIVLAELIVTFGHIWHEVSRNPVESLRYE